MLNYIISATKSILLGRGYNSWAKAIDVPFYKSQLKSVVSNDYALHYHLFGWREGLNPNMFFETNWYLDRNKDVNDANINPLDHYLRFGWLEHRDPSPHFQTDWYLARYTDVCDAGVNPLMHFLTYGIKEGRQPKPSAIMQDLADNALLMINGATRSPEADCTTLNIDDFIPKQIEYAHERSAWVALGNDPQFVCSQKVSAGFLQFQIRGSCLGMRPAAAREAVCELFFDLGSGYVPDHAYTFPISEGKIEFDALIFIEFDAKKVRVDPVSTDCLIKELEFSMISLPLSKGLQKLHFEFCFVGNDRKYSDAEFLCQLQWSNVSRFIKTLSRSIDKTFDAYQRWIAHREISPADRGRMLQQVQHMIEKPKFSIVMPTYKAEKTYLKKAIDSVRCQIYTNWELCIVDDGSNEPSLTEFLHNQSQLDNRIFFKGLLQNSGISSASNEALKMAGGDFVVLLDQDDEIAPQALFRMAEALNTAPDADMLYSDEDKIDEKGVRSGPFFKPDWSPEFFMSCMYTCHLGVYRCSVVREVGGFRTEFNFAQDYDLALRISRVARRIVHVSDILYHWRTLPTSTAGGADAKPTAELAAQRALQAHIDAKGLKGLALPGPFAGSHRVKLDVLGKPLVSIIIPTAARRVSPGEQRWYLLDLLRSLRSASTYPNYEILIVDNGDVEPSLERELASFAARRVTYEAVDFNISRKMNLGVESAKGEFVILLNDDMMIATPDWIEELLSWVQRPGIVAAGGKLLFPDKTVQHAGVVLLAQGPSHIYYGDQDYDPGLVGSAVLVRNYSAVTGACLAVRKVNYQAVGGFDPSFRVNYNDVDFCLKLLAHGRIVYTPFSKLLHYESVSKSEAPAAELSEFNKRWSEFVGFDPYFNVHWSQSEPNTVTMFPQKVIFDYSHES